MIKIKKIFLAVLNPQFLNAYIRLVSPLFELRSLIKNTKNVKTIIDVGSNKGQFLLLSKYFYPNSFAYSFEPQKKPLEIQKKIIKKNILFFNFGLGAKKQKKIFYITNREDSSSVLKPKQNLSSDYQILKKNIIKIDRLDKILQKFKLKNKVLLKIDVQGYELSVLKGALNILKFIDYIIIEVSFIKIYKSQTNKKALIDFLNKKNFRLKKIINHTHKNDKILQADCLFEKKLS